MRGGGRRGNGDGYSEARPFQTTEISREDLESRGVRRTMNRRAEKE